MRGEVIACRVPADKIAVIPNAVDRDTFRGPGAPDRSPARSFGLCGKTVLGFFGSFYSYEGLDLLVRALSGCGSIAPRSSSFSSAAGRRKAACARSRTRVG
ncbi:MAG: hypothetical protein ACJ8AH_26775 [Stellaceae bacterium]